MILSIQCQRRWAVLQRKEDVPDGAKSNKKVQQGTKPKGKSKKREKPTSDRGVSSDGSPDEDGFDVQPPQDEQEPGAKEDGAPVATRRSTRLRSQRGRRPATSNQLSASVEATHPAGVGGVPQEHTERLDEVSLAVPDPAKTRPRPKPRLKRNSGNTGVDTEAPSAS